MRALHSEHTALVFLAHLELLEGRPHSAMIRLEPLVSEDLGWGYRVTLLSTPAEAYLETGDVERAHLPAERAVAETRRMEAWLPGVEALRVLGMVEMRRGNYDRAERTFEEGLQRARGIPFPYVEARILHTSGLLDRERGEATSADAKFSEALAIVERLGAIKQAEAFAATISAAGGRRARR
jgi:ATP/maltotriose-dependent transcriptional regulator MalT